jgi:hypothetical protein
MNIKKYKLLALLGVGLITALTTSPTLKDLNAALTAPTSWTYKYTNQDFPGYKIRSTTGVISTPAYTRTADGAYYNYTNTSTITSGLTATQTFNRSNTTWYDNTGTYIPSDTKIGSNGTVSAVTHKWYFEFDNETNKDYVLYLDLSSTSSTDRTLTFDTNGIIYNTGFGDNDYYIGGPRLYRFYIPSFSNVKVYAPNISSTYYADAWYLLDLGVSDAYDAGVDAGYIQGQDDADLLVTGFQAMVGILVNFALMIANLEVFGISLMGIFAIVVLFAGIVWTLKLIRG